MKINMTFERSIRAACFMAALAAVSAVATAAPAPTAPVQGWQALIGCWEPVPAIADSAPAAPRGHRVCILPVEGSSALEFVTIADGQIMARERVDANGAQQPLTRDDCTGWQSAEWSATGQRLFVRSELTCGGGLKRSSSGIISMPTTFEWVDVQAVTVGAAKSVRTVRYREVPGSTGTPTSISEVLGSRPFSMAVSTARIAAAVPVSADELVDVVRRVDAPAVEAWLAQQQVGFKADAGQLVRLANAGLPSGVIDMVVALSYPDRFTVAAAGPEANEELLRPIDRPYDARAGGYGMYDPFWSPFYGMDRRYYSPYGYSSYYGGYGRYGYGYYNGWYMGQRPVVIVVTPDSARRGGGRVVNGRGYTRRSDAGSAPLTDRERSTPSSASGSSSSSGRSSSGATATPTRSSGSESGSAGSSSTGSSSGSGSSSGGSSSGERTAKRRPPPAS